MNDNSKLARLQREQHRHTELITSLNNISAELNRMNGILSSLSGDTNDDKEKALYLQKIKELLSEHADI